MYVTKQACTSLCFHIMHTMHPLTTKHMLYLASLLYQLFQSQPTSTTSSISVRKNTSPSLFSILSFGWTYHLIPFQHLQKWMYAVEYIHYCTKIYNLYSSLVTTYIHFFPLVSLPKHTFHFVCMASLPLVSGIVLLKISLSFPALRFLHSLLPTNCRQCNIVKRLVKNVTVVDIPLNKYIHKSSKSISIFTDIFL